MSNNTTMSYGTYNFRPVPLVNLNKQYDLSEAGVPLGVTVGLTLEGTLVPTGADGEASGYGISLITELQDNLSTAVKAQNGNLFLVSCDSTPLISGYPIVNNISFPPSLDQWVNTSPYTIDLEYYELPQAGALTGDYYIRSASESWNLELASERKPHNEVDAGNLPQLPEMVVTHSVSAAGKSAYDASGLIKPAWQHARDFVISKLAEKPDNIIVQSSGVINYAPSYYYDHMRTSEIDELGGTFTASETWSVIQTYNRHAKEDFSISVASGSTDGITTVSVDGTILGLSSGTYGSSPGSLTTTHYAYDEAVIYFSGLNLYARANNILSNDTLGLSPVTTTVGHNPPAGTITYSHEYNNKPDPCISGVLSETITISDVNPTDVFAQLIVCGRARGPVLQSISTVNAATRDVNVEVAVKPTGECATSAGGPRSEVEAYLAVIYSNLLASVGANPQVFKHQDNETWVPSDGRYSRHIGWTYQSDSTTKYLGV